MMEDEMEFSLARHHPGERRYIVLKELKKPFLQAFAEMVFRRNK